MKILVLLLAFSLTAFISQAQTDYTWDGSESKDWAIAANWTPEGIPGPDDNVTIVSASNNPQLSVAATINNFSITGGTFEINSTGSLTINGTASQSAAVFLVSGSTLTCANEDYVVTGGFLNVGPGATMNINGSGKKLEQTGGIIFVLGSLTTENLETSGGSMTFQSSSTITINDQLDILSGGSLTCRGVLTSSGDLGVNGTLNISGSSADFTIDGVSFVPGGTVTVNAGSAELKGGLSIQSGGSMTIENNATVIVTPGNVTISGSGSNMVVNQGTLNVVIGDLTVETGTSLEINSGGQVIQGAALPVK